MAKVFISYRRADSAASSGRIYDRLVQRFHKKNVFKDVDNIPPGVRFADYIQEALRQCAVVLVVIGRGWLTASNPDGSRRLDDPADFVRLEIEQGLALGLMVIPVLVEGASMPAAASLPDSLKELAQINAIEVRNDPDFTRDIERVVAVLERAFARPRRTTTPPRQALLSPSSPTAVPAVPASVPGSPEPPAHRQLSAAGDLAAPAIPPAKTTGAQPATTRATTRATNRRRSVLLSVLAAVLIVSALGVLLTQKIAAQVSASQTLQTQTAGTRTAGADATNGAQFVAQQAQTVAAQTQTAVAQEVHFPYHAAAPGPRCDQGNAPWQYDNGTSSSNLKCFSDHTQFNGVSPGIAWHSTSNSPFPQNFTLTVQVSNLSTNASAQVTVGTSSGTSPTLDFTYTGEAATISGATYYPNASAIHTLSITVAGTHVTYAVDSHVFGSDTEPSNMVVTDISLFIYNIENPGSTQPVSCDYSNFTIG